MDRAAGQQKLKAPANFVDMLSYQLLSGIRLYRESVFNIRRKL